MKISNWDTWQTFRKDRGTPPWIKVYRNLLSNEQWVELTDSEKGQLVSIWILAADKDGTIPDSPKMIQRMAMLDSKPNLSKFIELGFLTTTCQPDDNQENNVCPQDDVPEKRRVEESRGEENKEVAPLSNKSDTRPLEIFEYWCDVMNKKRSAFSPKRKKVIEARLKDGYPVDEIKTAIINCSNTPHNMGRNENNKEYNDIELICRSSEKLEQFRDNPGVTDEAHQQSNQTYADRIHEQAETAFKEMERGDGDSDHSSFLNVF